MNNNVKRLLKLIGTLLPSYKFIQVSETRIEISYRFTSIPKRTLYIGFFIISTMKVPKANSYVTFAMPKDIPFNVLKDWINIGITLEASKNNSKKDYYQYYKIELNDDEN